MHPERFRPLALHVVGGMTICSDPCWHVVALNYAILARVILHGAKPARWAHIGGDAIKGGMEWWNCSIESAWPVLRSHTNTWHAKFSAASWHGEWTAAIHQSPPPPPFFLRPLWRHAESHEAADTICSKKKIQHERRNLFCSSSTLRRHIAFTFRPSQVGQKRN